MPELTRRDAAAPPAAFSSSASAPPEPGRGNPLLRVARSARRHWIMVLAVWIFVAAPACAWVWLTIKPTFTASAEVKIKPNETPIMYRDLDDSSGAFDSFINTEARALTSSTVLTAALADPALQGQPLLSEPDPLTSLRRSVKVTQPSRTFLLDVEVTQDSPEAAILVTGAVMRAYAAQAGGDKAKALENDTRVLREENHRLEKDKQELEAKKYRLAMPRASTSQSIYSAVQESNIRYGTEVRLDQSRAEAERTQIKSELEQLEKGLVPTTMPAEDILWREQQIENDDMVRSLRAERAKVAQQLAKPGNHAAYEAELRRLDARLSEERTRTAEEVDQKLAARNRAILDDQKQRVQVKLRAVEDRIAFLEKHRLAAEQESKESGEIALQIKSIEEQLETNKQARQRVEDRLHALEVEAHRSDRISVDTNAEILPNGISDRRRKLTAIALAGGLFLGVFLAFVRDRLSGSLYAADDVESAAGLHLLGSLPALEDLRRGRVTEHDFRESYRAIRATLAGRSPNGQVPRTILVTSAQAAEGKTSLAVSLAASLAEDSGRVLIIDGDVQAPRIASTLKLDLPYCLGHVLLGDRQLAEAIGPTSVPGLDVLLGNHNGHQPAATLTGGLAAQLLRAACERYDHVIIDSPPTLGCADSLIWAGVADGVVLSSFAGHSNLRLVRDACHRLVSAGGRILGAVICNVSVRERFTSYSQSTSQFPAESQRGHSPEEDLRSDRCPHISLTGRMLTGPQAVKNIEKPESLR